MDNREQNFWDFVNWCDAFGLAVNLESAIVWLERNNNVDAGQLTQDVQEFLQL